MPVYTVHAPLASAADFRATDKFIFVRDGFHFWAMVFGPLWLIWKRLWLALLGWIIAIVALEIVLARLGAGSAAIVSADVMVALLMGFEAASLQRWTLSRRNWRQLDVVVADDEETAERRFFDRWTAKQRAFGNDQSAVDRGGAGEGATVLRHLRRHAIDGDPRQGARHHRGFQLDRGRCRKDHAARGKSENSPHGLEYARRCAGTPGTRAFAARAERPSRLFRA